MTSLCEATNHCSVDPHPVLRDHHNQHRLPQFDSCSLSDMAMCTVETLRGHLPQRACSIIICCNGFPAMPGLWSKRGNREIGGLTKGRVGGLVQELEGGSADDVCQGLLGRHLGGRVLALCMPLHCLHYLLRHLLNGVFSLQQHTLASRLAQTRLRT